MLTFGLMTALLASGYGVMFTVLDDFRDEYGIEEYWLGAIVGVGFLSSFVAQMLLAPIADRGRARQLVVWGLILNIVGLVGMAFGEEVPLLLLSRFVMGIGVGMATPAVRRIVINGDPINLGSNLGLLLAADVAGFAAGPAISALLVPSFGIAAPFLVIAALTVAALPIVLRTPVTEAVETPQNRFAFDLLRSRPIVAGLMMGAALFMMIGTFDALWAIVLDDLGRIRLDRQRRHHVLRPAARVPRFLRWTVGAARRSVPARAVRADPRGDVHVRLRLHADRRGDARDRDRACAV